ncbi:GFA family protein [Dongia sp.]|uniref:GFA family protein n=1 Tax=Dongia sp. TaxID=1977262 RepID=UPI0035ADF8ED
MSADIHHGQCLCGSVQFDIEGDLTVPAMCHCAMCRRNHGALGVYTTAPVAKVRLQGEEDLRWFRSSGKAERGFCGKCGSKLFWRRVGGSDLDITMGSLDKPTGLSAEKHIWVDFKGEYYDIADGLPQFARSSANAQPSAPARPMADGGTPPMHHHASCLCGEVDFTVTGKLRDISQCHCSQCRRWHGHAPAYTKAKWADVSFKARAPLTWFQSSDNARRGFCSRCGSSLFWERIGADAVSISAGAFDAPFGPRQRHHIFVADKGDYYDVADGLPQFPGTGANALPF